MEERKIPLPDWEIVRLLGRGSFGEVYEIQRNNFGNIEKAALKVITIPQSKNDIEELYNDGYDSESITARFQSYLESIIKEYSLMTEMKGHGNIVYCDDLKYIQHDDGIGWDIYIKMELLTPLVKSLPQTITDDQVIRLGTDICNALMLCKSKNIVHRDIKPQNIFVSQDGSYKLGDFGVAKTAERTTSGTKVGTYKYMAPEVYKSEPYGAGADIYSLGLVMYWMLNERRTPFLPLPPQTPTATMEDDARLRRFKGERLPAPAHGSEELKRIVLKGCAYDPKERYHSAAEMREDLLQINDRTEGTVGVFFDWEEKERQRRIQEEKARREQERLARERAEKQRRQEEERKRREEEKKREEAREAERIRNQREAKEKRKRNLVIAMGTCICLLIAVIVLLVPKRNNKTDKNNTSVNAAPSTQKQTEEKSSKETVHNHSWKAATCTLPKTCVTCGATSGSEAGHQWTDATYNEPKTCQVCGATEGFKKKTESSLGLRDIISSASASSVYSGDNLGRHGPEKMYDGKLNTNWTEDDSGNGIGEHVTFYFDDTYAVKKFQIYIGSHYNEGVYRQNCRPKVVTLTFSDGSTEQVHLDDTYDGQTVTFGQYYYTDYVKLTIDDVYTGTKYLDTVIAELDFVAYRP